MTGTTELVRFWAAVTDAELKAISDANWRRWSAGVTPFVSRQRSDVVAVARSLAREHGGGNVVRLEVDARVVAGLLAGASLPDGRDIAAALASPISTESEYRGAVDDVEIARAESGMGLHFPSTWRNYLSRSSWFYRGWMATGAFVWLNTPAESAELVAAWSDFTDRVGMIPIGGDGAGEMLTVDAGDPRSPVMLTPHVSIGRQDSLLQCDSIDELVDSIEDGTFDFNFDDREEKV